MPKESQPMPISEQESGLITSELAETSEDNVSRDKAPEIGAEKDLTANEPVNGQEDVEGSTSRFISKERLDQIKKILKEEVMSALIKILIKVLLGAVIGLGVREGAEDENEEKLKADIIKTLRLDNLDQETKNLIIRAVSQSARKNRGALKDITPAQFLDLVNQELDDMSKTG